VFVFATGSGSGAAAGVAALVGSTGVTGAGEALALHPAIPIIIIITSEHNIIVFKFFSIFFPSYIFLSSFLAYGTK